MMGSRKQELDLLRIFACLLVISSHLLYIFALDVNSSQWEIANVYYVGRNACVPLFFALSGILLLKKSEFPAGYIFKKIAIYAAIYVAGCTFYNLWGIDNLPITLKTILDTIIPGMKNPMLMWYLAELCGIYAFIPILVKIAHDERLCKYYLAVWVIYNFIIRNLAIWLTYLGRPAISDIASVLYLFNAKELLTYSGYLLMGYYLYYHLNEYVKGWILLFILLASIGIPAFLNQVTAVWKGVTIGSVYDYNGFSALIQTGCYILIGKQYLSKLKLSERGGRALSEASACAFGVYLIHPILTGVLLYKISDNILIGTPIAAVSVFLICCAIVTVVRRGKRLASEVWRTWSWKKRKFLIAFCAIWIGALLMTRYNCGLYGDGSNYLLWLISGEKLIFSEPFVEARGGVMILTRIFTYVLMKLGITNVTLLACAYSFGCVFWVALFLTMSLYICYKYHSCDRILNHTIIVTSLALAFGGLYCTHPALTAAAILWFIFICIYSWNEISQKTGWYVFLTAVLLFCFLGTYESFGVIGPAILLYCFVERVKNKKSFFEKKSLIVIVLILLNSIFEFYWIQNPDNPAAKTGLINTLFSLDRKLLVLLIFLAVFLSCTEMFFTERNTKILAFLEAILSCFLFIYIVCNPYRIALNCRVVRNLFNLVVPFLFVLYETLLLLTPKRSIYASNILAVSLSIACLTAVFGFGSGYLNYLQHLNQMADSAYGFVAWDPVDEDTAYHTQWTVPNESVLASAFFSNSDVIHGIVVERPEINYYRPYDMWNINAYYDLQKYGIFYDTEAFEGTLHREEAGGELFHIDFTDEMALRNMLQKEFHSVSQASHGQMGVPCS